MGAEDHFDAGICIDKKRKVNKEIACSVVFYMSFLIHMIICFIIFGSKNTEIFTYDVNTRVHSCPDGYVMCKGDATWTWVDQNRRAEYMCMKEALCDDVKKCVQGLPNQGRWLSTLESRGDAAKDVWDFLEKYFYQPLVLFSCVFVLAGIWLALLAKYSRAVVWGTFVADFLLLVAIFIWFLVEIKEPNIPCIIGAIFIVVGCWFARKKIDTVCTIIKVAMEGLITNLRLFAVTFAVQCLWIAFFAMWIAAIIGAHFVREVVKVEKDGRTACEAHTGWATHGLLIFYFIMHYHIVTAFFKNINTMMITANLSGWYFNEPGYKGFWMNALYWSLGPQSGGNAVCATIIGFLEYLTSKVKSNVSMCFSCLNPFDWPFLCLALLLKHVAMVFTKYGLIAMTFSGGSFLGTAPSAFKVLKNRLGEAVICDYIGKRIMSWCTYLLALGVAFAAWAWADDVQDLSNLTDAGKVDPALIIIIMILFAWLISYPLVSLICIVYIEQILGGFNIDWNHNSDVARIRMTLNSLFAAVFMGCISQFILEFISGVVVTAMDVALFCYCVESEIGRKQSERFSNLYESIKETIGKGTVAPTEQTKVVVKEGVVIGR